MNRPFNILQFISNLLAFSPRQAEGEQQTAKFIMETLKRHRVPCTVQSFRAAIPRIENAELVADGKQIPCKGCCFQSGSITGADSILSSLIPTRFFIDQPNINFNPRCRGVSLSNFYFAPAVAITRNSIPKILRAQNVQAKVKVSRHAYQSCNILVGNSIEPGKIVFAHYDSIGPGAIDNASGVAVMMSMVLSRRETLRNTLYVFSGNEELSYDYPTYWGHGFRVFENRFSKIMTCCKKMVAIDCIGNGKTCIFRDKRIANLAFPIKNAKLWQHKIIVIGGDIDRLLAVYHSDMDLLPELKAKYLQEAEYVLMKTLLR